MLFACQGAVNNPGTSEPIEEIPGGTPPAEACMPPSVGAPVPLRRVNATHIEAAVREVLGVRIEVEISDENVIGYRSNITSSLDRSSAQAVMLSATDVAAQAAPNIAAQCGSACDDWVFDNIAARLFRRPLAPEDRVIYQAVYDEGVAEGGSEEGVRWLVEAIIQSPRFLYLLETPNAEGRLDGYSLGARLANSLWGTIPDEELLTAAAAGDLETQAGLRIQAERMISDDRFAHAMEEFVEQWLKLEELEDVAARPDFAALPDEEREALLHEPGYFLAVHIWGGAQLEHLLTSTVTPYDSRLDAFYGDESVSVDGGTRFVDPARRAGLITLPAVQAALAHADLTSPSRRGMVVMANLLCAPPPPPPPGVSPTLPPAEPGATLRQRLAAHFEDPTCAGCHRMMDGIGFTFEHYDELGRYRSEESPGVPIDASSDFHIAGHPIVVDDAIGMMGELAPRWDVATCFASQWIRFATGVGENEDAVCLIDEMGLAGRSDGGIREMILTYVESEWFRRPRMEAP